MSAALARIDDDYAPIVRRAEAHINARAGSAEALQYEIEEGITSDWYLVHTHTGEDAKAMRHLARRRFGVFRPMQQKRRGNAVLEEREPVFPGCLFVYVWNMEKMKTRILACPGVFNILCVGGKPYPINRQDESGAFFIDRLRALSWVFQTPTDHAEREAERHIARQQSWRRPNKREREKLNRLKKAVKRSGIEWDQETWDNVNALDPQGRIALLRRTLSGSAAIGCAHVE